MSVFLNCLLRAKNLLTGGGYNPPDCCGDFNGGGPDDPVDDGNEVCGFSEQGYCYCTRSTTAESGTTSIECFTVNSDDLINNNVISENYCTGPGNTFIDWPEQVGPGATGDPVHDFILQAFYPTNAGELAGPAFAGGLDPKDCTTFNCSIYECVDPSIECDDGNGCQEIEDYKENLFKCSFAMPGTCYSDCETYFSTNPLFDPNFETLAECEARPCCDDSGGPGGGSGQPPQPGTPAQKPGTPAAPCNLFVCNPSTNKCGAVQNTAAGWFGVLGITSTTLTCQALFDAIGPSVTTPNGTTYYKSFNTCKNICSDPPPPPGIDPTDLGDFGGGSRPISASIYCQLWKCVGSVATKVDPNLSLYEIITQLGALSNLNSTNCGDLPPVFVGSDGVTYATNPSLLDCDDGGGGGGSGPISADGFDGEGLGTADPGNPLNLPTGSRTTPTQQGAVGREFVKNESLRATDPDLTNINYRRSTKFIPEKNISYRKDLFAPIVHYSLESINNINTRKVASTDLPFGELTLNNIEQSLNYKIRERLEKLRSSVLGDKLRVQILKHIRRRIIEGSTDRISIDEIIRLVDNFDDSEAYSNTYRVSEAGAVDHAITEAIPLDPNQYGSEINKEMMRLWKTVATDVDKHLLVTLNDGTQDKVFINQDDSFELSLSDGTTSSVYISPGDVYWTANAGNIPIQYDRDRVMALNFKDMDKVFSLLNQDNTITLTVSSAENANFLVEKDADLASARPEAYVLALDPETIEDLERNHDLIRISEATYDRIDYSEVDDWMGFNPFPFNTFYVDNEDPFLDHIERTGSLKAMFKDFSLDLYLGYNDDMPIFPRRLPWTIAIIPTDREELQTGSSRSELVSLTERKIVFERNLSRTRQPLDNPILDLDVVGYGQGAIPEAQTDNQVQFRFNVNKITEQVRPYKNNEESLPRKANPVRSLLNALQDSNTDANYLESRSKTVPWPVVLKNMSVSDRKLLYSEVTDYNKLRSKISLNKLATKDAVKNLFPKVSSVPIQGNDVKVDNYVAPAKSVTRIDGDDFRAETPSPLP